MSLAETIASGKAFQSGTTRYEQMFPDVCCGEGENISYEYELRPQSGSTKILSTIGGQ